MLGASRASEPAGPLAARFTRERERMVEEQPISQPFMVGIMTPLLRLGGNEKVLEIGTGSGYQTAVLAELARRVCSVERIPSLAARARATLEGLGYTNVWVRTADGTFGWSDEAPFDRILVSAASPSVPAPLFEQLAEGGRMVLPVGDAVSQTLTVVERVDGKMRTTTDAGCVFVKLIGRSEEHTSELQSPLN